MFLAQSGGALLAACDALGRTVLAPAEVLASERERRALEVGGQPHLQHVHRLVRRAVGARDSQSHGVGVRRRAHGRGTGRAGRAHGVRIFADLVPGMHADAMTLLRRAGKRRAGVDGAVAGVAW